MKKLIPIKIFSISLLLVLIFAACSKYEENTEISLKTKKARLCREWERQNRHYDAIWEFTKNNKFTIDFNKNNKDFHFEYDWQFSNNKTILEVDNNWHAHIYKLDSTGFFIYDENGEAIIEDSVLIIGPNFEIIKLTPTELVLEYYDEFSNTHNRDEFKAKE